MNLMLQVVEECPDQLLPACESLFPQFLEPALAHWEKRLQTPCQGAHGEQTTFLMYVPDPPHHTPIARTSFHIFQQHFSSHL